MKFYMAEPRPNGAALSVFLTTFNPPLPPVTCSRDPEISV